MSQALSSAAQPLCPILIEWAEGKAPSPEQKQQIINWERRYLRGVWTDSSLSTPHLSAVIESRATLLQRVIQRIEAHADSPEALPLRGAWSDWMIPLWVLWLPLAQQLDQKQTALGRPFIQGVLGGQGTGKTTLSKMLQFVLLELGHEAVPLSIDDLYLTYAERQLLLESDARLIWRGPPGTHDIALGIETLSALKSAKAEEKVSVPQFDKSLYAGQGDRTDPLICTAPTIVLFEGWFVGARPLASEIFERSDLPDPITTAADRQFAKDCNERLARYVPLWDFLDALMVLHPRDYRLSQQWRQAAEHKMKASGRSGLSDDEIAAFVTYFWQALHPELFITPLTHSMETDLVVYIESDHSVGDLRAPVNGHPEKTDYV